MNDHKGIFIFTKDRPKSLRSALESVEGRQFRIFVIDDSASFANQKAVEELAGLYSSCAYLGQQHYLSFMETHNIILPHFSFLLRQLGNPKWNLGFARNFALLFSKTLKLNKVLYMDDDIVVSNSRLVEELFDLVGDYELVGAAIDGLVDDSILGHMATDLGMASERGVLSGGFMLFNPQIINNFFLNNYNEDWVWQFLQLNDHNYLQRGSVLHTGANPFVGYENRIRFQEFGEIVIDGFFDLRNKGTYETLTSLSFWKRMLRERSEYIELLNDKAEKESKSGYKGMIEFLRADPATPHRAEVFQGLFQKYFEDQVSFLELYKRL